MARIRYSLSNKDKIRYAGFALLNYLINGPHTFPVLLSGNDLHLEPILQHLRKNDTIIIKENRFIPTESGRTALAELLVRYKELDKKLYVYDSVDLEEGEFGIESIYDFDDEEEWNAFLNDERWEDLRITVLEYKIENKNEDHLTSPVEFVFMSFLKENRFDFKKPNWQNELLSGEIWQEILETSNAALSWKDLGDEDVIEDIIEHGLQLMADLEEEEE